MPPCASARLASATVLKWIPKFNASDREAGQTAVVGLDAGWRGRMRGGDCVHSGDSAGAICRRREAELGSGKDLRAKTRRLSLVFAL